MRREGVGGEVTIYPRDTTGMKQDALLTNRSSKRCPIRESLGSFKVKDLEVGRQYRTSNGTDVRGEEILFPPYKHHLARECVARGMSAPKKERPLEKGKGVLGKTRVEAEEIGVREVV